MKRNFVIILFFVSLSVAGQSRTFVGIRGGAHFSSAYINHTFFNPIIDTEFIPGYSGGIMVKYFHRQHQDEFLNAGLQGGVNYVQKGWAQAFLEGEDEPDFIARMNYLEFPLEAHVYMGQKKMKPFFTLGMYLEYLLSVDQGPFPNEENLTRSDFYPYNPDRDNKFGYGARVSVGIHRDFSFGAIQVDGFFSYSISDFIDYGDFSSGVPDLTNHYVAGFSVAYLVPFGKLDF